MEVRAQVRCRRDDGERRGLIPRRRTKEGGEAGPGSGAGKRCQPGEEEGEKLEAHPGGGQRATQKTRPGNPAPGGSGGHAGAARPRRGAPRWEGGAGTGQLPRGKPGEGRAEATWGRGMPGRRRPGLRARWAAAGGERAAASPLPGMSEEPPRRLPSILGSAASPAALGGGHSARPGARPHGQAPAAASPARPLGAARRDPRPRPPQQRLPQSLPRGRPPSPGAGAGSHARGDWLPGRCVRLSDSWASQAPHRGGGAAGCAESRGR